MLPLYLFICWALLLLTPCCLAANEQCSAFAPPVLIKGRKFFDSVSGKYVPIVGINYYPRPNAGELVQTNSIDFFTEEYRFIWERDIANFKKLNVNVVRLYAVNPGLNHDAFMCALQEAGIYVIVGLAADCENCAITSDAAPDCYPAALKQRGQFIISSFARYDNVLSFSAGNEVSLKPGSPTVNAVCQKQFVRDMRAFIDRCSDSVRRIPIGLAIADVERQVNSQYYNCRSDPSDELENADFIGINTYLHCDGTAQSSGELIGYETLLSDFASYKITVPVILTDFGCISASFPTQNDYEAQRNFLQVDAIFSERYRTEFVGGIVFEYSTERINSLSSYPFNSYGEGNFGVGFFSPENCDEQNVKCTYVPFPQFETLSTKYSAVDTNAEPIMDEYTVDTEATLPACPAIFPALNTYAWPSAETEDLACPNFVYIFCPGIPEKCSNLGIAQIPSTGAIPTRSPTTSSEPETTEAPNMTTTSPNSDEKTETEAPTMKSSMSLIKAPSPRPTTDPSESDSTLSPSSIPVEPPSGESIVSTNSPTKSSSTPSKLNGLRACLEALVLVLYVGGLLRF